MSFDKIGDALGISYAYARMIHKAERPNEHKKAPVLYKDIMDDVDAYLKKAGHQ